MTTKLRQRVGASDIAESLRDLRLFSLKMRRLRRILSTCTNT